MNWKAQYSEDSIFSQINSCIQHSLANAKICVKIKLAWRPLRMNTEVEQVF